MKKTITAIFITVLFFSCTDKKAQEKAILDEVLKVHDKVMGADEQLTKNKMLLDSMVKFNSTAEIKDSVYAYKAKLNLADSAMENWMHKFDPEYKGKTDDEAIEYLNSQKKQIALIDSQLNAAITASGKYLQKMKMK